MEIAFYLVIGGVFLAISLYRRAQTRDQWEQAANDLGLEFSSGLFSSGKLSGRYNGAPVEVYQVTRGGKRNRKTYTVFEVGLPPRAPGNLVIAEEGMLAGLGKFVGMQDIEIGESIFDSTFVIKGNSPPEVKRFLNQPRVTDELLEMYNKYPQHFEIKDGFITFEVLGAAPSFEIEMALDDVSTCLNAMRGKPAKSGQDRAGPRRSGPFGGFPTQGPPTGSKPPESATDDKFGPPSQNEAASAPNPAGQKQDNTTQDSTENQPDDWW